MAVVDEDRLDRNNRNISDNGEKLKEQYYDLKTSIAVITTKMEALTGTVEKGFSVVEGTFKEFNNRYATKEDLKEVKDEIGDIRKNLNRGVWIVLTAVVVGVLSLLFKVGLTHP